MSAKRWQAMAKRLHDRAGDYLSAIPADPEYAEGDEIRRHDRAWDALHKALAAYRKMASMTAQADQEGGR